MVTTTISVVSIELSKEETGADTEENQARTERQKTKITKRQYMIKCKTAEVHLHHQVNHRLIVNKEMRK